MSVPTVIGTGWFPHDTGGLSRYVRGLGEALAAAGSQPRVLVTGAADDAPPWVESVAPGDAPPAAKALAFRRACSAAEPLDVHFALHGIAAVRARRRHAPFVSHFHGPWADEAAAAGSASRAARAARLRIERAVHREAAAVVTLSAAFRRLAIERYGVEPWRAHVIRPGVDLAAFAPGDAGEARARLGLPADAFVVVAARRLVARMGIDTLLDAWPPGDGSLLLVVGDGPERDRLERRAPGSARFLGRVSDEVLADVYRAADLAVLPSLALEGFGLAALEALACGTPVVAADVGGLPEAIDGLADDLLVPPGDAAALRARLADARSGARPLPSRARCRAHAERFGWEAAAAAHLDLYASLASPPARRRRVVLVDHTALLSGGELALARLVPALDAEAHVVLAQEGPLVRRLEQAGVSVEVLPLAERTRDLGRERVGAAGSALAALGGVRYGLRLARRLRRLRPDLVHTNSLKSGLYGGLAGRLARVPVVWHVRDRLATDYLPARAVRLVHRAERLASAVIVDTEAVRATLARPARAHVVPSPTFAAPSPHVNGAGLRVGIVGRLAPWKGQDVFLAAFARAFPGGDAQAVVVGEALFGADEEAYADGLRAQAAALGIEGRVDFRGFRAQIEQELARLDVLVHASVLPEPFGLVVAEGMAAGLTVVAADAGGPAEVVTDGEDGLLYPPGDVAALAAALLRAGDEGLRRRLGAAARTRAAAFAPATVAAAVERVYDTVAPR